MASYRWQQGNSKSLNKWLWVRVGTHFLTVCAASYTMYSVGMFDPQKKKEKAEKEAARRREEIILKERPGFEERLKQAEETHAVESSMLEKITGRTTLKGGNKIGTSPPRKPPAASASAPSPHPPTASNPTPVESSSSSNTSWWSKLGFSRNSGPPESNEKTKST